MTILTFNCHGIRTVLSNQRMRLIVGQIKKLQPDLVFLQEVFFPWHKKIFRKLLKNKYPYHYLPRRGLLRAGGGLCCFSRYPIVEKYFRAFWRKGFWGDKTWRDKFAHKGFAALKIKGPITFYAFNTHVTANYLFDYSGTNRQVIIQESQLKQLARGINQISKKTPCFLAGDLNVVPDTILFSGFLSATGCLDLTKSLKSSIRNKRVKIDYVLFRGDRQVSSRCKYVFQREVSGTILSDHYGILVKVNI